MFDKLFMKNTVISAKFKSAWQKYYKIIIYNTHYKLLEVEDCSSSLQLPLHSRMEAVSSHEAVAGYKVF